MPVWAQRGALVTPAGRPPGGNPPTDPPSTSLTLTGPTQVCQGATVTLKATGDCSNWSWDTAGGTILSQQDVSLSSSTTTVSWSTPGTYNVTVTTDCFNPDIASLAVTVVATTPGTITTSGAASQVSATEATICLNNALQLIPPTGSANWSWDGANITSVSSAGVATIRPTADENYYKLNYTSSGANCPITTTFLVKVAVPPVAAEVVGAGVPGGIWRLGTGSFTLAVKDPKPAYVYTWYDGSNPPVTGTTYTTGTISGPVHNVTVKATACQQGPGTSVALLVRKLALQVVGATPAVPTGSVRLTPGVPLALQVALAQGQPTGQAISWFLNDVLINNQAGLTLNVTQPGRYVARINYPASVSSPDDASQAVEVVTGLAAQTANDQELTYLSDTQVLKAGVTSANAIAQLNVSERTQRLTYLTGWAQPLQQVGVQAGPAQEDLVQHYAYTGLPTTVQTYLPFSIANTNRIPGLYETDPVAKLTAYYAGKDSQPYGTAMTEASPLSRSVSQAQAGSAWANHTARVSYATNTQQDAVRRWQGLDGSSTYSDGQLLKEVLLDADDRRTEQYKDPFGRVVLQRKVTGYGTSNVETFDTYSVYAPTGYLQYTIPPAAVAAMAAAGTWTVNAMPTGFADKWLYQYTYDGLGRLVERKFPGAAAVYLVYDSFDRPILVQDGTHRAAKQWLFTKFDAQNRAVVSGLYYYNNTSTTARQDLQALANGATSSEYESRNSGGYTTNQTFPAVQDGVNGNIILSMSFFDDYDLDQDANHTADFAFSTTQAVPSPPVATTQLRGLPTIIRSRVIKPGGQYGDWLVKVLFYDEYGNLIQKQSNNLLQSGSTLADVATLAYREQGFLPQVLNSLNTQQTAGQSGSSSPQVQIRARFSYDAAGRRLQTWQQHQWKGQWEPEVLVSSQHYTGLGEMTQKQLHSRDGVAFLQNVDFAYNLHGQLARINQSEVGPFANPDNDLFGLIIYRENAGTMGNTARYDGGISAVSWMAHNTAQTNQPERERSYRFNYDGLGRLKEARYAAKQTKFFIGGGIQLNPWNQEVGAYDEKDILYDANGNITALKRYSQASASASPALIDNLTFTYTNTGNQHSQISDAADATRGFKDATAGGTEYTYDTNGSIVTDANKNVAYAYNTLGKVEKQTVGTGTLEYTYDATGTLLQRDVKAGGVTQQSEYYVDGLVYRTTSSYAGLASVPTAEGRAILGNPADARLTYEYHLRDHLGNLRVAFRAQAGTADLGLSSETNEADGDYPRFTNVASTRSQDIQPAQHGSYEAAVTNAQPGPRITIPVSDQDRIKVRVYYQTPAGVQYYRQAIPPPTRSATGVAWAVAPVLLPTMTQKTASEAKVNQPAVGAQVNLTGLLSHLFSRKLTAQKPPVGFNPVLAYIRWSLQDNKGNYIRGGTQEAYVEPYDPASWTTWTKLELALSPADLDLSGQESRTGRLLIEEVNEGSQAVYFDSLTITHPQDRGVVSQENHYYPFGMALSGVAVNTTPVVDLSKEQFNQGSMLQDELLGTEAGIYSTFYRSYDPTTGRFTGVDPLADVTPDWTPYQFALSNPIVANDPTGALSQADISFLYNMLKVVNNSDDDITGVTLSFGGGGGGGGGGGNISNFIQSVVDGTASLISYRNGQLGFYSFVKSSESRFTLNADGSTNIGRIDIRAVFNGLTIPNVKVDHYYIDLFKSYEFWDAVIGTAGGVIETAGGVAGEGFTAGVSTALVVDGGARVVLNGSKVISYLTKNKEVANFLPSNAGALTGKLIDGAINSKDGAIGTAISQTGSFQTYMGLGNDIVGIAIGGGLAGGGSLASNVPWIKNLMPITALSNGFGLYDDTVTLSQKK